MQNNIKCQLRKKIKSERAQMSEETKANSDTMIAQRLINSGLLDKASLVLIYLATKIEVDTNEIINYCLSNSIPVAVPRCEGIRKMNFYYYNNKSLLEISKYGIYEPVKNSDNLVNSMKNTVCIVPGLSFDKKGYRLGYGGGFYDTFISENPQITTVGICYNMHISELIPVGIYDKHVNYIVTEKTMEVCNG